MPLTGCSDTSFSRVRPWLWQQICVLHRHAKLGGLVSLSSSDVEFRRWRLERWQWQTPFNSNC